MAGEQGFMAELEEATTKAHIRIAARYLEAWGRLDSGLPRLRDPVVAALDDSYGLRHLTWHLDHGDADSLHRLPCRGVERRRSRPSTSVAIQERLACDRGARR